MMSNNSLISLIQNSHGNSKTLQKILNSAAYKELPLEQQASTLLTIIENSERNKEVLVSVIEELKLKLRSEEFSKTPIFFNALISLIKYANGNSNILMLILGYQYDDICTNINIGFREWKQIQEFFITITESASGNIEVLQRVLEQIVDQGIIYNAIESVPGIVLSVVNCSNGNVKISEKILTKYNEYGGLRLDQASSEQQKAIFCAISRTVIDLNILMLEDILKLARSLTALDLKEVLMILAERFNKDIEALTKIIDCAHEYLPSQQQKDFLINLVEITNKVQAVVKMVVEQTQYLLSPYGDEVLRFLDTVRDPDKDLLSFTASSPKSKKRKVSFSFTEKEISNRETINEDEVDKEVRNMEPKFSI